MTLEHLDTALGFVVFMLILSLLITILVQTATAVLGLRGSNLRWGVEQLITQLDPGLVDHARVIAQQTLRYSAIAPIWRRKATAVRPGELIRVLDQLARSDAWDEPRGKNRKEALEKARTALKRVVAPNVPERSAGLGKQAELVAADVAKHFPRQTEIVKETVDALGTTGTLLDRVNVWFETIMDRTTERFVAQTRWITATIVVLFCFLLQIDTLHILERLSTNSEFRSKLVATSEGTLRKAEEVVAQTAERKAVASEAVAAAREQLGTTPAAVTLGEVPSRLVTREQGEAWLRDQLKNQPGLERYLVAYNSQFDDATKTWLGELRASTLAVSEQLGQATFQLIPNPYPPLTLYMVDLRHLVGTLMSALLLSLGAPFWFNVLREVANLRPAIARKVADDSAN